MPKSLEQSIRFDRESVIRWTDAASNWRSGNERGRELSCLYQAVQHSLCVAVSAYETPQSGIEYLKTEFKPVIFDRTLELIRELHLGDSAGGGGGPVNIGAPGLFQLLLTVHAAWLLDLYAEAEELASVCADENQIRSYQSGTLWRDYGSGLAAVALGRQFTPKQKKYKGYDSHWATYLQLMAAICAGGELLPAITLIDRSFSQRNRDKRLMGDGLDGDGTFSVKWDFRKHSLLRAAAARNAANDGHP